MDNKKVKFHSMADWFNMIHYYLFFLQLQLILEINTKMLKTFDFFFPVRLCKERISLVQKAVDSKSASYKQKQKVSLVTLYTCILEVSVKSFLLNLLICATEYLFLQVA